MITKITLYIESDEKVYLDEDALGDILEAASEHINPEYGLSIRLE